MKAPTMRPIGRVTPRFLSNFDSATGMLKALSNYLRGEDFPNVGIMPHAARPLAPLVNALPRQIRETMYVWGGWGEALPPDRLGDVRAEHVAEWVTNMYPKRQYQAAMIGSSTGAMVHLGAALGIPWLPQTVFIPVRRSGIHPDEPAEDMEWGREPGRRLLDANPEWQLHHMHDPNQDRLMVERMTYFRVKWRKVAAAYERFLEENLQAGGTLFLLECQRTWPTVHIGERHVFQPGALGGATEEEFLVGSERVEAYLEEYESHRRSFDTPIPDGESPEAEWGFEPALRDEIQRFAEKRGYKVRRVVFEEPEHLSPLVADLYRWWYQQRRIRSNRLLIESFFLLEPWWTLRTGSVPFWMKFNMYPSLEWVQHYLDTSDPYDYINLMLFMHGVDAVGLPSIEQWQEVLNRAQKQGSFIGVEPDKYPRDFGVYLRYQSDLKQIPARYEIPGPMALSQFDEFLQRAGSRYPVRFPDDNGEPPSAEGPAQRERSRKTGGSKRRRKNR